MTNIFKKAIKFQSQHPIFHITAHALGGFGLAIILQQYLVGNSFLPVAIGWILIGLVLIEHFYALLKN